MVLPFSDFAYIRRQGTILPVLWPSLRMNTNQEFNNTDKQWLVLADK
jgi:hypothetical protein